VPSWHYYQAIHEHLVQGLCTAKEALRWLEAIKFRSHQISAVFQSAVGYDLSKRGVSRSHRDDLHVSSKSSAVGDSIHEALARGNPPNLSELLLLLTFDKNSTWSQFYSLLPEKDKPQSFKSLGCFFYISQVAIQALLPQGYEMDSNTEHPNGRSVSSTMECGINPRCLLISIDDSSERKIYLRTQKLLKKIPQNPSASAHPTLIDIYLYRRRFINNNITGSNLYLDDHSPELPELSLSNVRTEAHENLTSLLLSWIYSILFGFCMEWIARGILRDCLRELG
jgi:hypothetical protein